MSEIRAAHPQDGLRLFICELYGPGYFGLLMLILLLLRLQLLRGCRAAGTSAAVRGVSPLHAHSERLPACLLIEARLVICQHQQQQRQHHCVQ